MKTIFGMLIVFALVIVSDYFSYKRRVRREGRPNCFRRNPNVVEQAENECHTCPYRLLCLGSNSK